MTRSAFEVAFATIVGAGLVSACQRRPELIAALLAGLACAHLARRAWRGASAPDLAGEVFLLITIAVIGYLAESWGTTHGHWSYAHLPPGRTVPVWVPIAWSLAALLLDRIDEQVRERIGSPASRIGVAYAAGILFPWLGESICIASGVWTYHWPYQIAGVPLLALLLISYAHLTFSLIRGGVTVMAGSNR